MGMGDVLQRAVLQHPGCGRAVVLGEFDGDAIPLLLREEWNKFRIVVFDPFGGQRIPHHIMRVRAVPCPVHELCAGEIAQAQQLLAAWLRQTLDGTRPDLRIIGEHRVRRGLESVEDIPGELLKGHSRVIIEVPVILPERFDCLPARRIYPVFLRHGCLLSVVFLRRADARRILRELFGRLPGLLRRAPE